MKLGKSRIRLYVLYGMLATLLAGVVSISWFGPALMLAYHSSHFRAYHDSQSLQTVMQALRNGDTTERVEKLLGKTGRNQDPKYRRICREVMARDTVGAPSGFLDSDELLGYSTKRGTVHLQFREGRLVNHDPTASPFLESSLW